MKPFRTLTEAEEWMDHNAEGDISVRIASRVTLHWTDSATVYDEQTPPRERKKRTKAQ